MLNDLTRERWKTRRLMAWLSLIALMLLPYIMMFKDKDWLVAASGFLIVVIGGLVGIIMNYITAATVDDVKSKGADNV